MVNLLMMVTRSVLCASPELNNLFDKRRFRKVTRDRYVIVGQIFKKNLF